MEHERWGTPVPSYVAGFAPDARPLDRGKPRDEDAEGGSQPADKSLINRRLSLHSQPCAAMAYLADGELAEQALNRASPLDREHKRLAGKFGSTEALPDPLVMTCRTLSSGGPNFRRPFGTPRQAAGSSQPDSEKVGL